MIHGWAAAQNPEDQTSHPPYDPNQARELQTGRRQGIYCDMPEMQEWIFDRKRIPVNELKVPDE